MKKLNKEELKKQIDQLPGSYVFAITDTINRYGWDNLQNHSEAYWLKYRFCGRKFLFRLHQLGILPELSFRESILKKIKEAKQRVKQLKKELSELDDEIKKYL